MKKNHSSNPQNGVRRQLSKKLQVSVMFNLIRDQVAKQQLLDWKRCLRISHFLNRFACSFICRRLWSGSLRHFHNLHRPFSTSLALACLCADTCFLLKAMKITLPSNRKNKKHYEKAQVRHASSIHSTNDFWVARYPVSESKMWTSCAHIFYPLTRPSRWEKLHDTFRDGAWSWRRDHKRFVLIICRHRWLIWKSKNLVTHSSQMERKLMTSPAQIFTQKLLCHTQHDPKLVGNTTILSPSHKMISSKCTRDFSIIVVIIIIIITS